MGIELSANTLARLKAMSEYEGVSVEEMIRRLVVWREATLKVDLAMLQYEDTLRREGLVGDDDTWAPKTAIHRAH